MSRTSPGAGTVDRGRSLGVLGSFCTTATARGSGVGRALHDAAVAQIRQRGLGPCLDVLPTHERAYAMYPRLGWVEVGRARPSWLQPAAPDVIAMILPDTT